MPSSHLILCCPLLLLPPIPPSIRVFSSESTLLMRWPKYWSFRFSIIPSKEHPGPISFRMDWLDLLAVLRSLLQHQVQKYQFFGAEPSFYGLTLTSIHDYWKNRNSDCCCCLVASVMPDSVQPQGLQSSRLLRLWDSPGKNTGVGCHFHLQPLTRQTFCPQSDVSAF